MDDLLVGWLYGELDDDDARRFEAYLEGSAEARERVEALQRTRSIAAGLADEEPPAAVSAILLHEAALRAKPARSSGERLGLAGWLGKLFQPLVMHPAAAAMASLVLVAGVAGALYVRGGADFAQPKVESRAASPTTLESVPASPPAGASADVPPAEAPTTTGYIADVADSTTEEELAALALAAEEPAPAKSRARAQDQVGIRRGRKADVALDEARSPAEGFAEVTPSPDQLASDRSRRAEKKASPERSAVANAVTGADLGVGSVGGSGGVRPNLASGGEPSAATAAPEPSQELAYRAYRDDPKDRDISQADRRWAKGQAEVLQKAVADKKCRDAAKIANDILDRDPEFFAKQLEGSKAVERCEWYVSNERQRRVTRRKAARARSEADERAPAKADAQTETKPPSKTESKSID